MNKVLFKIITSQFVTTAIDESVIGCKEIVCKFSGNYIKRRNVGFKVIQSFSGSFHETKDYYTDLITGKTPVEYQPAVEFTRKYY